MLDLLRTMVINISIVVLLTLFLELLIPSGELRRYLRLVMGLLLFSVVLNPVLTIFNLAQSEPVFAWDSYEIDATQVVKEGEELAQTWQNQASLDYNSQIEAQTNELVTGITGVTAVNTKVETDLQTGEIQKIILSIKKESKELENTGLKNAIAKKVAGYYNLDSKRVEINMI